MNPKVVWLYVVWRKGRMQVQTTVELKHYNTKQTQGTNMIMKSMMMAREWGNANGNQHKLQTLNNTVNSTLK